MKGLVKIELVAPLIYWLVFAVCMYLASDFKPESLGWLLAALGLTLPWSFLTFFFVMGTLHLGDDKGAIILISITAVLNAFLIYLIAKPKKKTGELPQNI